MESEIEVYATERSKLPRDDCDACGRYIRIYGVVVKVGDREIVLCYSCVARLAKLLCDFVCEHYERLW